METGASRVSIGELNLTKTNNPWRRIMRILNAFSDDAHSDDDIALIMTAEKVALRIRLFLQNFIEELQYMNGSSLRGSP